MDTSSNQHQFPRTDTRATRPFVRIERRLQPGQRLADLGPLLLKPEVADRIKKSVSWVEKAYASGDFVRPLYVGRSAVWPQAWVDDWLQAQVQDQLDPQRAAA